MSAEEAPEERAPAADVQNLLVLQATVVRLLAVYEEAGADASTLLQVLGEEAEQRAQQLVREVRAMRGLPESARVVRLAAPEAPPVPAAKGVRTRLTGEHVRRAMDKLVAFTASELAAELGATKPAVMRHVKAMVLSGNPVEDGKLGHAVIYRYESPPLPPGPTSHPHGPSPESLAGTGRERRATGEAVRVAASEKLTRRGRSTPGVRHKAIMRDRRYEAMEAAKEARAREQRGKQHRKNNT